MRTQRALRRLSILLLVVSYALGCEQLTAIHNYIDRSWTVLLRSNATLRKSAADSKVGQSGRLILYAPPSEDAGRIAAQLPGEVSVRQLPREGEPAEPGLLYLPHPYIVPGGRFNEMYGWDSYFILLGLLRGRQGAARKGHDGQLHLRGRALRESAQRQPHLLPDPVAAAIPDADDPGSFPPDRRHGPGWRARFPPSKNITLTGRESRT